MSSNVAVPHSSQPLVNPDGTPNRVWYLYLQALSSIVAAPSVSSIAGEPRQSPNTEPSSSSNTGTSEFDTAPEHNSGTVSGLANNQAVNTNQDITRNQVNMTSNFSVPATDSRTDYNNVGAGGSVTATLPPASPGLSYCFFNAAGTTFVIKAQSGNFIVQAGGSSSSGGTATSAANHSTFCVTCRDSTNWHADRVTGTWNLA